MVTRVPFLMRTEEGFMLKAAVQITTEWNCETVQETQKTQEETLGSWHFRFVRREGECFHPVFKLYVPCFAELQFAC